jgi:hypothetical protein
MDAARYLVGGVIETGFEIDDGILEDLKVLGAPPEMLAAARASMAVQDDLEIFEDGLLSASVFDAMCTQWRYRPGMDGNPVGLNYPSLRTVMWGLAVPLAERRQVFEDVRVMEREALAVFAEKAAR